MGLKTVAEGAETRAVVNQLRDLGRRAAERWLPIAWDDLGVRSSIDVFDKFL